MRQYGRHTLIGLAFLLISSTAWGFSLEKLNIGSHLGEPLFAESQLQLEPDEDSAKLKVQIADLMDYQILEVYRDPAVDRIKASIQKDQRGVHIRLQSEQALNSPFLQVVLKIHSGNIIYFHKYALSLDPPNIELKAKKDPAPVTATVQEAPSVVEADNAKAKPTETPQTASSSFTPYEGWARISRYGPIVRGDTLSTIASRLRVDDRYTLDQVMLALYQANKTKFLHENINLLQADVFLDIPTAEQVDAIDPAHAAAVSKEHLEQFTQLKTQSSEVASEALAQQQRYQKHVRMGDTAEGEKHQASGSLQPGDSTEPEAQQATASTGPIDTAETESSKALKAALADRENAVSTLQKHLSELEESNRKLKEQLRQKSSAAASSTASGDGSNIELLAAQAQIKKLELRLTRLQVSMDQQRNAQTDENSMAKTMQWLLVGLATLCIVLLLALIIILRRKHPKDDKEDFGDFAKEQDSKTSSDSIEPSIVDEPEITEDDAPTETETETASSTEAEVAIADEDLIKEEVLSEEPAQTNDKQKPIDHLAEAEIYERYDMLDEARDQLQLAIKAKPDDEQAHAKLLKLLKRQGNEAHIKTAIAAAAAVLSTEAIARMQTIMQEEEQLSEEPAEEEPQEDLNWSQFDELFGDEEDAAKAKESSHASSKEDETKTADAQPQEQSIGSDAQGILDDDDLDWLNPEAETSSAETSPEQSEASQTQDLDMPLDDDEILSDESLQSIEAELHQNTDSHPHIAVEGDTQETSDGDAEALEFASETSSTEPDLALAADNELLNETNQDSKEDDPLDLDLDLDLVLANEASDSSENPQLAASDELLSEADQDDGEDEPLDLDFDADLANEASDSSENLQLAASDELLSEADQDDGEDEPLDFDADLANEASDSSENLQLAASSLEQQIDTDEALNFDKESITDDISDPEEDASATGQKEASSFGVDDLLHEELAQDNISQEDEDITALDLDEDLDKLLSDDSIEDLLSEDMSDTTTTVSTEVEKDIDLDLDDNEDDALSALLEEFSDDELSDDTQLNSQSLSLDLAQSLLETGQFDAATEKFQEALQEGEHQTKALLGLAEVALNRGQEEQALAYLSDAEVGLSDADRAHFEQLSAQAKS